MSKHYPHNITREEMENVQVDDTIWLHETRKSLKVVKLLPPVRVGDKVVARLAIVEWLGEHWVLLVASDYTSNTTMVPL